MISTNIQIHMIPSRGLFDFISPSTIQKANVLLRVADQQKFLRLIYHISGDIWVCKYFPSTIIFLKRTKLCIFFSPWAQTAIQQSASLEKRTQMGFFIFIPEHLSLGYTAGSIYKRKIHMLDTTRLKINFPCRPVSTEFFIFYCF